jgi:tetraacyldisaccharide 4'-kinase
VSDGTRFYGTAAEAGDEPFQLARNAPRATVVVDERRVRGARAAIDRSRPDVVVLDDAFQHRAIARDLDILVLDATVPLPTMSLLPAGLRREPFGAMRRAGLIAFSRALPSADLRAIVASVTTAPTVSVRFVPTGLGNLGTPGISPVASLKGKRSLAFCGIGNPEAFRVTLQQAGAVVLELLTFTDHHRYSAADLGRIVAAARRTGAELIVTTEKDSVRLLGEVQTSIPPDLTLAFVRIGVEFLEGKDAFHRLLDATMRRVA